MLATLCATQACGGPSEYDSEHLASVQDEVFNGTTVWDAEQETYVMQPTVRIRTSSGGICTGTALRNNLILTARHCTTTDGEIMGPLATASSISVASSPNAPTAGCNSTTCRTVSVVERRATPLDVALLQLSGALSVNGSTVGHSVRIDPFDAGLAQGRNLLVSGYGRNTAAGGAGPLRSGLVNAIDTDHIGFHWESWMENEGRSLRAQGVQLLSAGGQSMWSGDSGGPYWNQDDADPATTTITQVPMLLAVHSRRSGSGDSTVAYGTISAAFRNWINTEVFERTSGFSLSLTAAGNMSSLEMHAPVAGSGTPSWSITANGLTEPSNFNTPSPDVVGHFALHRTGVYENFEMSVDVQGTDDDAVGLIFWHRDDQNYLRFSVNEQDDYARLVRMTPNGAVTIAEDTTYSINFNTTKTLGVVTSGSTISAFVNGTQVLTVRDRDIMAGRVGLYENAMSNVQFRNWSVTPVQPMTTSVPF